MPDPRPYTIRRDGTVVDRQSGEVVGTCDVREIGGWLIYVAWMADGSAAFGRPRKREAADTLWAEHERRRAESLARRKHASR